MKFCDNKKGAQERLFWLLQLFFGYICSVRWQQGCGQSALVLFAAQYTVISICFLLFISKKENKLISKNTLFLVSLDSSDYGRIVDTPGPIPQATVETNCYANSLVDISSFGKSNKAYAYIGL